MTRSKRMIRLLLAVALLVALPLHAQDRKKPEASLGDDEKSLLSLLNKTRQKEKKTALALNKVLCAVARKHSENMAKQEKMSHVLDGKGVAQRVTAADYDYRVVAENLATAQGNAGDPAPDPADIHKHWMDSKNHRDNILNGRFTEVGLGRAISKKGNYFYTQVFAAPRK